MARAITSASKVEIYRFHPVILILTPVAALVLQTFLPLHFGVVNLVDLPLLVVIYFGLTRRNPVWGLVSGGLIGMAQDSLSSGPIGFFGSAKTVIGYVTSFASIWFAVETSTVRAIAIFILYYLQFIQLWLISAFLLGRAIELSWGLRLLAALVNTGVGVILFDFLDRFRRPA